MALLQSIAIRQRQVAGRRRCTFRVTIPKESIFSKRIISSTAWYVSAPSDRSLWKHVLTKDQREQKIVRQTFHEAVDRRPYTYDPHHAEHCFDALRQVIGNKARPAERQADASVQSTVCNADATPLYTFGDKTAGDGQMHKCRSWQQLRDYATENSACYRDSVADIPLGQHFGHCEEAKKDGIEAHEFQVAPS